MTFDSSDNATPTRRSASNLSFATQASNDKSRRPQVSTHSTKHSESPLPEQAMPSLEDLQNEEEEAAAKEELEIQKKREAAKKLAQNRGLSVPETSADITTGEPILAAAGSAHNPRPSVTLSTSSAPIEAFSSPAPEPLDYDEQED
ncbi:hypothetical protein KEM54_006928 [Ascosphaera aggregata]|nr:hypothetical protein KEM54_006928 [Ascosphaera aggregata]